MGKLGLLVGIKIYRCSDFSMLINDFNQDPNGMCMSNVCDIGKFES